MNNQNQEVRQVYKCKNRIPGMETSILCNKNQHGCLECRRLASIPCKRKELTWMRRNF